MEQPFLHVVAICARPVSTYDQLGERLCELQDLLQSLSIEPDDYGIAYDDDGKRIASG